MLIIPSLYHKDQRYYKSYNAILFGYSFLNNKNLSFGTYKSRQESIPQPAKGFKVTEKISLNHTVVGFDSSLKFLYLIDVGSKNDITYLYKFNVSLKQIEKTWNFSNGINGYYFRYFTLLNDNTMLCRVSMNTNAISSEVFYYMIYDLKNNHVISNKKENGTLHGGNCCNYGKPFNVINTDTSNKLVHFIAKDTYNSDYKVLETNYTTGYTTVVFDISNSNELDNWFSFKYGNSYYYDNSYNMHSIYKNNTRLYQYAEGHSAFIGDATLNGTGYAVVLGWGNYYDYMYWFDLSQNKFIRYSLYDENNSKINSINLRTEDNMSSIDANGNWWVASNDGYIIKVTPF